MGAHLTEILLQRQAFGFRIYESLEDAREAVRRGDLALRC
jgi:putative membrane protein